MYTVKSESAEGIYYLCNHWNKNKTFWIEESKIEEKRIFKTIQSAKTSLTKLLKIMPDYEDDKFSLVKVENGKITVIEELN